MNTFVSAIQNQTARTANGMAARKSTASACVDLFFKAGASRGKNITKEFTAALVENEDVALRMALWLRDARGVALVSGFSPAIMVAVLGGDTEKFTPEAIMLKALMVPKYDL